jgi:ABC-2 type transport system permease protein
MSEAASTLRATARAFPTLLRVGLAETVAYRAEFVVWMLTTTLPLVMLALWTSVASEGAFAQFQSRDFVAYYLVTLVVRNLTGSWVVWQINDEIRRGALSMRLLRPLHPFASYAASHLSAVPLRAVIVLPVIVVLFLSSARDVIVTDPASLAWLAASLAGAWFLSFFLMVLLGSLAFFVEKSMALFDVYLGFYTLLSGYLLPLALMPPWVRDVAEWTPFRFMLSLPVEIATGAHAGGGSIGALVGVQWAYAGAVYLVAAAVWRAGVRHYEAYGA